MVIINTTERVKAIEIGEKHLEREARRLGVKMADITKAQLALKFSKAELEGCPDDFLDQIKTNDQYEVKVNVTWHYIMVMDNAKSEATRKQVYIAQNNLCREENVPLLLVPEVPDPIPEAKKKEETSADWDEEKLRTVVLSKKGNQKTTTDKVCKLFEIRRRSARAWSRWSR